jgi:hypothetical protein
MVSIAASRAATHDAQPQQSSSAISKEYFIGRSILP